MTFIHLGIKGTNLNLDKITETLKLVPSTTYKQNEEREVKGKNIIYKEDGWIHSIEIEDENSCQENLEKLIENLYQNREYITSINAMNIYLEVVVYSKNYQYHVCVNNGMLKKIGDMGLDLWFTYMF